ncbi:MAG: AgmX/PglI C-terminal domain-containing protein [Deltaproteobacteria bacterium]|nr:AgmX/PglI C-terminal domain-containing protein [Deltaproteobacteria bacterium]
MRRRQIDHSNRDRWLQRSISDPWNYRHGADVWRYDRLYHTLFGDVMPEVRQQDMKAYERLLHNEPRQKKMPFWVESEAALQELRRQALAGGDTTDNEATRKLDLVPHRGQNNAIPDNEGVWVYSQWIVSRAGRHVAEKLFSVAKRISSLIRVWWPRATLLVQNATTQMIVSAQSASRLSAQFVQHRFKKNVQLTAEDPVEELQFVLTSYPPSSETSRQKYYLSIATLVIMVAAFIAAVMMIFSTPQSPSRRIAQSPKANYSTGVAVKASSSRPAPAVSFLQAARNATRDGTVSLQKNANEKAAVPAAASSSFDSLAQRDDAPRDVSGMANQDARANETDDERMKPRSNSESVPSRRRRERAAIAPATTPPASISVSQKDAETARELEALPANGSAAALVESAETMTPTLPFTPARTSVQSAMQRVAPQVMKCQSGLSGQLIVKLVVLGATGRVRSAAVVDDTFSGTPTAMCVERAMKNLQFPAFRKENLIIRYPFRF